MSTRFPFAIKPNAINLARDWHSLGAVASALLSVIMLFPPWLSIPGQSLNAFGNNMQAAGPALIIVMALATIILTYCALATGQGMYLTAALLPASNLAVIYIIKVSDVSDLADINNSSGTTTQVSTGVGVWLGLVFALTTIMFAITGFMLKRSRGGGISNLPSPPPGTSNIPPEPPEPPQAPPV
ncbi:hypothetical protein QMK19_06740 [Streptomyces sp. H10-C2]|uniref:hypothetical protein n=1 Tax=unclassified Streptomyces TaxID=2593676 RepID=UPI0024BA778F|nr:MULTISPECIES: hypothetical protein [unclassified Streptomyces]MDJ0339985.1 hypothetical protein [Streptomyces sp. PH10-H1]MDJ0369378.1 hypothetical protein [Streptomyces sp. H10-C2]